MLISLYGSVMVLGRSQLACWLAMLIKESEMRVICLSFLVRRLASLLCSTRKSWPCLCPAQER